MRGKSRVSAIMQCALLAFPWRVRRPLLNLLLGFQIDQSAKVGISLLLVNRVSMGQGAYIGHLNTIKGLAVLKMHNHARIGNLNWIIGLSDRESAFFRSEPDRISMLEIEEHAAVTNRHYIDCTNKVSIGAFSTFAGVRSQILTHAIDLRKSTQSSAPATIGRYCFVGTGVIVLKGAKLGNYCVLGAGSVLRSAFTEEYCLLSGVPAVKVRDLETDWAYFRRSEGFVV